MSALVVGGTTVNSEKMCKVQNGMFNLSETSYFYSGFFFFLFLFFLPNVSSSTGFGLTKVSPFYNQFDFNSVTTFYYTYELYSYLLSLASIYKQLTNYSQCSIFNK